MKIDKIELKRKAIVELLKDIHIDKPIVLPFSNEETHALIFEKNEDADSNTYYKFNQDMYNIIKLIDFSCISFDNVCLNGVDFTGVYGVKINPQTVYKKSLIDINFYGIEFCSNDKGNQIDLFDGVEIRKVDFLGSKGARINPQTIKNKCFDHCLLTDVDFTGFSFDDVSLSSSNFKGSKGAVIDPNKLKQIFNVQFSDVELLDIPKNELVFYQSSLEGSNYKLLLDAKKQYKEEFYKLIEKQLPKPDVKSQSFGEDQNDFSSSSVTKTSAKSKKFVLPDWFLG